jgi:hypothetical protein
MILGGCRCCTLSIHWPGRSVSAARFSGRFSHFVSKRPIWLAEAAEPAIAWSPTTQRIAGSRHSLSASFTTITSDAGLLAYRELDDTLGLTDTGAGTLANARTGKNGRHRLAGLLRQSVFGRLAGYEDDPRNCSRRRRLKSSLRPLLSASPAASLIDAPFDPPQTLEF